MCSTHCCDAHAFERFPLPMSKFGIKIFCTLIHLWQEIFIAVRSS